MFGLRADEVGVNVATVLASLITTVPGTSPPVVSRSVKVGKFPAEDELSVAGSMGWLKVAVTMVPVSTLPLEFKLVGTFVAQLLGLDESTVGSVAAPGATAAKVLPIPPVASKVANSNAINIGSLDELSNLVIRFILFHESAGCRRWPIRPPIGVGRSRLHIEAMLRE